MKYYACVFFTICLISLYLLIIAITTDIPEEIDITSIVEPLPEEVLLPVITGSTLPADEIKVLIKEEPVDEKELDLLARLIQAEAGADWCTDELQLAVGSVVLNRMDDSRYPDTMKGVIYQDGQYSTAMNGKINNPATLRAIENARYLLENGSTIPKSIVFQANFPQRKVYTIMQGVYFGE
jgi:hypothetical protein